MSKGVRPVNPEALLLPKATMQLNQPVEWMSSGFLYWIRWALIVGLVLLGMFCLNAADRTFLRSLTSVLLCMLAIRLVGRSNTILQVWRMLVGLVAAACAFLIIH
jgi:hypothetical protein